MVKRTELLRELGDIAKRKGLSLDLVRHGANHDIYQIGAAMLVVGRHADVPELTAKGTIRKARNA